MTSRFAPRTGRLLVGASLAAAMLAVPTAATAAPAAAQQAGAACEVSGGALSWGVKESFRSYISGSIANGSWETSDGAGYETPSFLWSDATGTIDPVDGTGAVSFTGTIHFTGHGGVLDLTLANPTIEFEGDGKAALLLDAKSTDMEGETAVDATAEWVGDVTAPASLAPDGDALELAEMPVQLTGSGAEAFAGFYEAGEDLDPLTLTLEFEGCDAGEAAAGGSGGAAGDRAADETQPTAAEQGGAASGDAAQAAGTADAAAQPAGAAEVPWLPIVVGGVALLVMGLTLGLLIAGRKPKAAPADPSAGGLS